MLPLDLREGGEWMWLTWSAEPEEVWVARWGKKGPLSCLDTEACVVGQWSHALGCLKLTCPGLLLTAELSSVMCSNRKCPGCGGDMLYACYLHSQNCSWRASFISRTIFERQALESPGLNKSKLGWSWDSQARLGDPWGVFVKTNTRKIV